MKPYIPLVIICLSTLHGCGFQPLYRLESTAQVTLSQVEIGLIPNRSGQKFRNLLYDQFYPHGYVQPAVYRLDFSTVEHNEKNLSLTSQGTTSRRQITMSATYKLWNINTQHAVLSETRTTSTWYTVSREPFATLIAKENALDRVMQRMSEQIALRILTTLQ